MTSFALRPFVSFLIPFALPALTAVLGCDGDVTSTSTGGTGGTGTGGTGTGGGAEGCVHQPGAVPGIEWSLVCGGPADEYAPDVARSGDGVLLGLQFGNAGAEPGETSVDFGGGPEKNFGAGDILVGAFDTSGAHVWSEQWSDANAQFFSGIADLGAGRFALLGVYRGSLAFSNFAMPEPADPQADTDFIAILENEGAHVAHVLFPRGTPDSHVGIVDIAGGPSGEVAIAGRFRETIDFGAGDVVAEGLYDGFVAVYEGDGSLRFLRVLGGAGQEQHGRYVTFAPDGSLLVAGTYEGELDVGDGAPFTGAGPFLATLAASGEILFKRDVPGSAGPQYGTAVAVAPDGDLIFGGMFLGEINLGGDDLINLDQEQIEETNYDLFVARFDPQGGHRWSVRLGDPEDDDLLGVHVEPDGRVLAVWGGETSGLRVTAIEDPFAVTEVFAAAVSGARAASFGPDGAIHVTGYSDQDIDFGAGSVPNAGGFDVWLARLVP